MHSFADWTTPRYQLPVKQPPRGIVPFPPPVRDGLDRMQQQLGRRFAEAYLRQALEDHTLIYYYEGLPVAFRAIPEGLEVLGVGYDEVAPYWTATDGAIRVVTP